MRSRIVEGSIAPTRIITRNATVIRSKVTQVDATFGVEARGVRGGIVTETLLGDVSRSAHVNSGEVYVLPRTEILTTTINYHSRRDPSLFLVSTIS